MKSTESELTISSIFHNSRNRTASWDWQGLVTTKRSQNRNEGKSGEQRENLCVQVPGMENDMFALYVTAGYMDFKGIGFIVPGGGREHLIEGKIGKETEEGFIFHSTNEAYPGNWEFIEVTYENFKTTYHKKVQKGESILSMIHNTQELQDYYHANFPDYT